MKILLKYICIAHILFLGTKSYGEVIACDSVTGHPEVSGVVYICKYEVVNLVGYNCGTPATHTYSWKNTSNPGAPITTSTYATADTGRWELRITNTSTMFVDRDTLQIRFHPATTTFFINANAPVITKCESQTITLTATSGPNIINYKWFRDGDPTVLSMLSILNITTVPSPGSAYYITTATHTLTGCALIDTIYVSTFATPQPFLGADTAICNGQSLILSPKNLSNGNWQFSWNGAPLSGSVIIPPALFPTFTVTTTQTVAILVKGPFPNPCTGVDTIRVTVNPVPSVTAGTDTTLCQGASKQMGAAPLASHNYSWSPTSGLSNAAISNPVFTTTTLTGANTYWVTVTNPLTTCASMDNAVITVNPTPIANAGSDGTICAGDSLSLGVVGTGGVTYLWTPATGLSNANIANPKASPAATPTNYKITASYITGCLRKDSAIVTVNPVPIVNAGATTTICNGTNILLNASVSGPAGPYTFAWTPSATLDNAALQSPLATPIINTPYSVLVTVQATSCSATAVRNINVNPLMTAMVTFGDSVICPGESIQLQASGSGGTGPFAYAWTPLTNITNPNTATPTVNPASGITYNVTVTDFYSCSDDTTVMIDILWVNLGSSDTTAMVGQSILLDALNATNGGFTFEWEDSTGTFLGAATYLVATTSGRFTISVINPLTLCQVTDTINVIFENEIIQNIYIPSAFNPSMPDGNDSNLRVYGGNISNEDFMFKIFNKWGQVIYQTTDFKEANLTGWNGNFENTGQAMTMGVYTYTVIGKFVGGTAFEQTGTTSLLR